MVAYNKFNCFVADVCNKVHNCSSDSFSIMLTNTAPVATNTVYSNLVDLSTANGYTAGGTAATGNASTQTSGTETFTLNNVVFTATGAIGPFRYAVLYNSTSSGKQLVAWWDYGSSISLANGDTFTVAFNGGGSSGSVFTMA
jgi:hypothetical protein